MTAKHTIGGLVLSTMFGMAAAAQAADTSVPLDQKDLVPLAGFDEAYAHQAVSLPYVLKTGYMPLEMDIVPGDQYHIDWSRHDALVAAIENAADAAIAQYRIETLKPDYAELKKSSWTRETKQRQESLLAEIVAQIVDSVPGLGDYRTVKRDESGNVTGEIRDITLLNDLVADIEAGTQNLRFDCGIQSAIEGVIVQKAERRLLPLQAPAGDFKKAGNYFLIPANLWVRGENTTQHVFVLTPAGGVIEATADPSQGGVTYVIPENGATLEQVVRGRPVIMDDMATVYDPAYGTSDYLADQMQRLMSAVWAGTENGQTVHTAHDIENFSKEPGIRVLNAESEGFMLLRQEADEGMNTLVLYQLQNKGTPLEGFVMVADALSPDGTALPEIEYFDAITEETYIARYAAAPGDPGPSLFRTAGGLLLPVPLTPAPAFPRPGPQP